MQDPTPPFPAPAQPAALDVDGALARCLRSTLDAPPSLRERLRAAPTPLRVGLVATAGLLPAGLALAVHGPRPDLAAALPVLTPPALALLVLGLGAAAAALRPVAERAPSPLTVAFLLLTPLVPAALPGVWPGSASGLAGAWACGGVGLALAAGPVVVAALVDRGTAPSAWRLVAAAAAGGLLAAASSALLCAQAGTAHLVVGHALVGPVVALAAVLALRISLPSRPRSPA